MWARPLLRQSGLLGSVYGREFSQPLQKQYAGLWRSVLQSAYSTSPFTKSDSKPLRLIIPLNPASDSTPYSLTKEEETAITKNDPVIEAKLSELLLKLFIKKEQGENLPSEVRIEDLEIMLHLGQSQLSRMLRHVLKRSIGKEKTVIAKEERRSLLGDIKELRKKEQSEMEHPWLLYSLHNNALFSRIFKRSINNFSDCYLGKAIDEGQKVIIDCSYDSVMDESRIKHTAKQILFCHVANRKARRPFSFHICNLHPDSRLMYYIRKLHPEFELDAPVGLHSDSYLNHFDRDRLVYLSPHSNTELKYNPNDIYILGAMVDMVSGQALSNKKAIKENIRTMCLPLDKYMHWKLGSKSLCIHQCFETLLTVKNTGDWERALRENVPQRKVWNDSNAPKTNKTVPYKRRFKM